MIYVQLNPQKEIAKKRAFQTSVKMISFSNDLWYLSFHTVQKMYKGAFLHVLFCFFPTRESCFPKIAYLIIEFLTHNTQNKENNNCHETLVLA